MRGVGPKTLLPQSLQLTHTCTFQQRGGRPEGKPHHRVSEKNYIYVAAIPDTWEGRGQMQFTLGWIVSEVCGQFWLEQSPQKPLFSNLAENGDCTQPDCLREETKGPLFEKTIGYKRAASAAVWEL